MDSLTPNSHKWRESKGNDEEREKLEKVTTGTVKRREKNGIGKVAEILLPQDLSNMKKHLVDEVLVPRIMSTIVDLVTDGVNLLVYGDTKKGKKKGNGYYVSYDSRDRFESSGSKRNDRSTRPSRFSFDDLIFDDRGDAEIVLDRLDEIIEKYGFASVLDLYDIVGLTGEYTDRNYGWSSIRTADVKRIADGYILKMPYVTSIR